MVDEGLSLKAPKVTVQTVTGKCAQAQRQRPTETREDLEVDGERGGWQANGPRGTDTKP